MPGRVNDPPLLLELEDEEVEELLDEEEVEPPDEDVDPPDDELELLLEEVDEPLLVLDVLLVVVVRLGMVAASPILPVHWAPLHTT